MNTQLKALNDMLQDAIADGDDQRVRQINMAMIQLLTESPSNDTPDGDSPDAPDAPDGDAPDGDGDAPAAGNVAGGNGAGDGDEDAKPSDSDDDFDDTVNDTVEKITASLPKVNGDHYGYDLDAPIDQAVQHESRPIVKYLRDRLQFENADATSFDDGHRSGRLLSRNAVAVACGDDTPFSKRNDPSEPARVFVQIMLDSSGSMGFVGGEKERMRKAAQVAVALNTVCGDHPGIDFEIVKYANRAAISERPESAVEISSRVGGGTDFANAFYEAVHSERRKLAVANRDAIVQVLITDGCMVASERKHFKTRCTELDLASSEERCCVLIDPVGDTVADFALAYSDPSRVCAVKGKRIHECAPFIASAIQRTITRAEARRG
tara:strand:- start:395 stop:1531 length:1137 start_codon:yes stop_codon:yes gene_type:complete